MAHYVVTRQSTERARGVYNGHYDPSDVPPDKAEIMGETSVRIDGPYGQTAYRDAKDPEVFHTVPDDHHPESGSFAINDDGQAYKYYESAEALLQDLRQAGAEESMAQKTPKGGSISVQKATEGESYATYTQDSSGGFTEAHKAAEKDQYLVTRLGEDGKPVLNEQGQPNQWLIDKDVLSKTYVMPEGGVDSLQDGAVVQPMGEPRQLVKVPENFEECAFPASYGGKAYVKPGGYFCYDNGETEKQGQPAGYALGEQEKAGTYQDLPDVPLKYQSEQQQQQEAQQQQQQQVQQEAQGSQKSVEELYTEQLQNRIVKDRETEADCKRYMNSDDYWAASYEHQASYDASLRAATKDLESAAKETALARERGVLTESEEAAIREVVPDYDKLKDSIDVNDRERIGVQIDAKLAQIEQQNPDAPHRESEAPQSQSQPEPVQAQEQKSVQEMYEAETLGGLSSVGRYLDDVVATDEQRRQAERAEVRLRDDTLVGVREGQISRDAAEAAFAARGESLESWASQRTGADFAEAKARMEADMKRIADEHPEAPGAQQPSGKTLGGGDAYGPSTEDQLKLMANDEILAHRHQLDEMAKFGPDGLNYDQIAKNASVADSYMQTRGIADEYKAQAAGKDAAYEADVKEVATRGYVSRPEVSEPAPQQPSGDDKIAQALGTSQNLQDRQQAEKDTSAGYSGPNDF